MGPEGVPGLRAFELASGATGWTAESQSRAWLDCPICGIGAELIRPRDVTELCLLLGLRIQALAGHYREAHPDATGRLLGDWEAQREAIVAWADPGKSAQSG